MIRRGVGAHVHVVVTEFSRFQRVTFSQDDIPVEYLRIYYRADRYALHNELTGGDG